MVSKAFSICKVLAETSYEDCSICKALAGTSYFATGIICCHYNASVCELD